MAKDIRSLSMQERIQAVWLLVMAIPNIKGIVMSVIGLVLALVVTLQMLPTMVYYIGWINATTLAGVPLASVLILIAPYATFFLVLGIVLLAFNTFSHK